MVRCLIALSVLGSLVGRVSAHAQTPLLQTLIRPGQYRAELLELWTSPRQQELTDKVKAAAQADPAWFQEHAAAASPGEPLPYHPKLGLTKEEYAELLRYLTNATMRPADTVTVKIESTDRGYRLGTGPEIPSLRELEIDTLARQVRTSVGVLAVADPILPSEGQEATGEWGGPRWNLEELSEAALTGTNAQFAVGRHSASGRTILYFDVTKADAGQVTLRETRFLKFLP